MRSKTFLLGLPLSALIMLSSACHTIDSNTEMKTLLADIRDREFDPKNDFAPEARLRHIDSVLTLSQNNNLTNFNLFQKAFVSLQLGDERNSEYILTRMLDNEEMNAAQIFQIKKQLALTYLRMGERKNCLRGHNSESCIFPVKNGGVHIDKSGSQRAIEIYEELLRNDSSDLESRWLLNIAYMTTGNYPQKVPKAFLIPGLEGDTNMGIKPFTDAAINTGLNTKNMAGGSLIEDFNNDGYLDIVSSAWDLNGAMHYCRNNTDGSFTDISEPSGLKGFTGGLNIMQTDYNNDGLKDIFVLRGAWKGEYGREPNSLLRNNGDGTFTDVTKESGLLSFHPTQTATWNDFNNDGWLDVFIGNESSMPGDHNFSELFINKGDGTFRNVSAESGAGIINYVKGVTSGDYDNDGLPDIFISTMTSEKILLHNETPKNGPVKFRNVTTEAGLNYCRAKTFGTWFWDYDNDGWLDLFVCNYDFTTTLGCYAAAEALGMPTGQSAWQYLYHNNHDGTFTDVTKKSGLDKIVFAMGCNFGDIDNDGYPDIYLGTGNPNYQSLIPNKMFHNIGGKYFTDVTAAARVGNLQKGHGVAFADLDNDGDQDIYIEVGGAFKGDSYQNSLYINPGQNNNHWINISLEGVHCNRAAIGARIKVTFNEDGAERSVYHDVNSGGSFGANPLMQHIGIGQATEIKSIEIKWPGSQSVQMFRNILPDRNLQIREGDNQYAVKTLKPCDFTSEHSGLISCGPGVNLREE